MRYVTEQGVKYRIRGTYTATQLRSLYEKLREQYPNTKLTFASWLVRHGKVYNRVRTNHG